MTRARSLRGLRFDDIASPLLRFCRKTFRAAQRPRDEKQSLGRGIGGGEKGKRTKTRERKVEWRTPREREREKDWRRGRACARERERRSKSEYVFKNTPLDQIGLLSSW